MCENKVNVCFIGSGIMPVVELMDYLNQGYNVTDIEQADVAFKLSSVSDQEATRQLKIALQRMIIILDEDQLKALRK